MFGDAKNADVMLFLVRCVSLFVIVNFCFCFFFVCRLCRNLLLFFWFGEFCY